MLAGFKVYKSYKSEYTIKTGYIVEPETNDIFCNYHAVAIVGYVNQHYIIKNTYGEDWGDCGYGYIHEDIINRNLLNFSFYGINYT